MGMWAGKSDWISCFCLLQDDLAFILAKLRSSACRGRGRELLRERLCLHGGESLGCGVRGGWNHFGGLWTKSIAANVCIFSNILTVS